MKIYALKGVIQHYNWGGKRFIPSLLGLENVDNKPWAEYWMGAHPKAPSILKLEKNTTVSITDWINRNPEKVLGTKVFEQFASLPFLFKVLDVQEMLSIQVHPSRVEAEKGFAQEEKRGIPINATNRNYKDNNHKPEIMVALSPFWLLHGFRPEKDLQKILQEVQELRFLLPVFNEKGYKELYRFVMEMPQEQVTEVLTPLRKRLEEIGEAGISKDHPDFWALNAINQYTVNGQLDRGIFSIYLFNLVKLEPGEGIFQDAGIPHAYLEGQNMELMANSDNVLRGGLTPKHIDVPELLKHTRCEAVNPEKLVAKPSGNPEIGWFAAPVPDFLLGCLASPDALELSRTVEEPEIGFLYEGELEISNSGQKLLFQAGESWYCEPGTDIEMRSKGNVRAYLATVPGN